MSNSQIMPVDVRYFVDSLFFRCLGGHFDRSNLHFWCKVDLDPLYNYDNWAYIYFDDDLNYTRFRIDFNDKDIWLALYEIGEEEESFSYHLKDKDLLDMFDKVFDFCRCWQAIS